MASPASKVPPDSRREQRRVAFQRRPRSVIHNDLSTRRHGERDPHLPRREPPVARPHDRADAGRGRQRVANHVASVRRGDHRAHARPCSDLRCGELGGHTAAAPIRTRTTRERLEFGVDHLHVLDERRLGVEPRIGGEQPRSIGEQHQRVGPHELRHERRDAVVVAKADLVVGDGIVLVHDGDHVEFEKSLERGPGVQILRPNHEVERRQQHLPRDHAVPGERLVVGRHEQRLPHRRHRLQRAGVARAAGGRQAERGQAGRDRGRRHQDDAMAIRARRRELVAHLVDRRPVDAPVIVGDRRGADLDDRDHRRPSSARVI